MYQKHLINLKNGLLIDSGGVVTSRAANGEIEAYRDELEPSNPFLMPVVVVSLALLATIERFEWVWHN